MNMVPLLVVVVAVLASGVSSAVIANDGPASLPQYVKVCPRDAPEFDACVLNSIKKFHPYLVKGVPSLNLPPIDPLKLDESLLEYHNGQVHTKVGIRDYSGYGLRDIQYQRVRTDFNDPENMKLEIDVFIPKKKIDGRYKLQGKFFNSEFGGKGIFNLTMSNIKATWAYTGSLVNVDGVDYLKMKHLDMEPVVGDMKIYASNLFSGNEALSKTALMLFNQNWRLVYKELLPYAKKDWDKIMTELANRVFMKVPFDEIFPVSSRQIQYST